MWICRPGAKVLDVGSGSGYLAACMSKMVSGNGGRVFGIDVIPELVEWSIENVKRSDPQLLESGVLNLRGTMSIQTGYMWFSR